MAISVILLDTGGVLYHRPREDRHLSMFLAQNGLKLRHRSVVERALRAARFDVQSGRISRETFYDAILRIHGITDEALFPEGRAALLLDAADIELFPGVSETLYALHEASFRLGLISESAHHAREKISWLSARGLPPDLWSVCLMSAEVGLLKGDSALFERALMRLDISAAQAVFVGHATEQLANASQVGITTIAFMPDDPNVQTDYVITSLYGLRDLFLK